MLFELFSCFPPRFRVKKQMMLGIIVFNVQFVRRGDGEMKKAKIHFVKNNTNTSLERIKNRWRPNKIPTQRCMN